MHQILKQNRLCLHALCRLLALWVVLSFLHSKTGIYLKGKKSESIHTGLGSFGLAARTTFFKTLCWALGFLLCSLLAGQVGNISGGAGRGSSPNHSFCRAFDADILRFGQGASSLLIWSIFWKSLVKANYLFNKLKPASVGISDANFLRIWLYGESAKANFLTPGNWL